MIREQLEQEIKIQRDLLNQIVVENNLNMNCEAVLSQSRVVDLIITKLMEIDKKS